MTSPASSRTAQESVLTALTRLTAAWSSPRVQGRVAADAGLQIDPADIPALYLLGHDGPQRAGGLAALLRLTPPTMSKQLSRLAAAGLVRRDPDAADRRARLLSLTHAGAAAYDALAARGRVMVAHALAGWSAAEVDDLAVHLDRLVGALIATTTAEQSPPERHGSPDAQATPTGHNQEWRTT